MDDSKRGVIIGMALGDGYVQVRQRLHQGKYPVEERSFRVLHGANQKAYCEWKAERLSWALGGVKVNVTKVKNGPGGRYTAYQFTKGHPYFGQVRKWLYPFGEKLITRRVLDMLTPEGLAIWYMDDGSARKNTSASGFITSVATDIATMCSEAEAHVICDWLKSRFGLEFKVRCNKRVKPGKQFYVQANTTATREFASIISAHVPDCMLYKLAHVASFDSHECQTPVSTCACGATIYENRRKGLCSACYSRERYLRGKTAGDDIVRTNGN